MALGWNPPVPMGRTLGAWVAARQPGAGGRSAREAAPAKSGPLDTGVFVGRWSYRSLLNNPNLKEDANQLLSGAGVLRIRETLPTELTGSLVGPGWRLELTGTRSLGPPLEIRFRGQGIVNGEEWIYDFVGYLSPAWEQGEKQRTTIVGSVVRVAPHSTLSGEFVPAGVVASWYAVRRGKKRKGAGE